jgi:single-strand DNA-binding protein
MPLPRITVSGNLTADPEVRFTKSGTAVTSLRVAASDRKRDDQGNWSDGDPCYLSVTVWKRMGENVAETLHKGDAVVITGRLRQQSYTKQDGTQVTVYDVEAEDIAPSLSRATASVHRNGKSNAPAQHDDPWSTSADDIPPF